jgi:tRNA(adenine34) deaminase
MITTQNALATYSEQFMYEALLMAKQAFAKNEVPVGAIVVKDNKIIGYGCNQVIASHSVAAHAEIVAISQAGKQIENYRLMGAQLYSTLEPCHMCAKAIVDARIEHIYFGALEPRTGALISIDSYLDRSDLNHKVTFSGGHMSAECAQLLKIFFQSRRG